MLNGLIPLFASLLALLWLTPVQAQATAGLDGSFTFVAMGDAPYSDPFDFLRFSGLIYQINTQKPTFTVHVGDFKSGSSACSDQRLMVIRDYFDDFKSALIYTPGDNEWTDCHRLAAGGWDPLDRLALLRRHYFSTALSQGEKPIRLIRQSDDPRFAKFAENARWQHGEVGFLTAHVVGSYNNAERRDAAARTEFAERDAASSAWITQGFAWAGRDALKGLVIFMHADPLRGRDHDRKVGRPFGRTINALKQGAIGFAKPVLLVHGDFHDYKLDKPFSDEQGKTIANLTRLEVHGAPDLWAVTVTVDPASPELFKIAPMRPADGEPRPPD
jgi:hypothetical protein